MTQVINPTYSIKSVRAVHLPLVILLIAKNQAGKVSINSIPIYKALARDIMLLSIKSSGILNLVEWLPMQEMSRVNDEDHLGSKIGKGSKLVGYNWEV